MQRKQIAVINREEHKLSFPGDHTSCWNHIKLNARNTLNTRNSINVLHHQPKPIIPCKITTTHLRLLRLLSRVLSTTTIAS